MNKMIYDAMAHKHVNLGHQQISDSAVKYLCRIDTSRVIQLDLCRNSITAIGALHLSRARWNSLTYLHLGINKIGNRGCEYLSWAQMDSLQYLDLSNNELESTGISHLAKKEWKIFSFNFSYNNISCNAITSIGKSNWKHIKRLKLCSNKLTGAESLQIILSETAIDCFQRWNNIEPSEQQTIIAAARDKFGYINIYLE